MRSRWLVLDTAAAEAVVGVVDLEAGVIISELSLRQTQRHAERLPEAVAEVLQGTERVAGVGVGTGPGSFIGVRTGIAYAKGLCRAWGVPLFGLPSLWSLASSVALPAGTTFVAALDAKRGERFAQLFHNGEHGLDPSGEPTALPPERVAELGFHGGVVVGVGGSAGFEREAPSVLGMMCVLHRRHLGADERVTLAPLYVRGPDAKLPALDPARHRPPSLPDEVP